MAIRTVEQMETRLLMKLKHGHEQMLKMRLTPDSYQRHLKRGIEIERVITDRKDADKGKPRRGRATILYITK